MLLAIFGIWGSFFNHKKALFMFLMGMIALLLLEIGYFVYEYLTFTSDTASSGDKSYAMFGMILSVIMLAFYFACAFVGVRLWKA